MYIVCGHAEKLYYSTCVQKYRLNLILTQDRMCYVRFMSNIPPHNDALSKQYSSPSLMCVYMYNVHVCLHMYLYNTAR